MGEREVQLAAFTQAVVERQWHEFEWLVKAAYATGASREELLAAIEAGRIPAEVPERLVALAYATVNAWQWMAIRRLPSVRSPRSSPMKGKAFTP